MPSTPTTPSQVQAYRFVLRRMQHALVRKDAVMLHDPMRTQGRALGVGLVLGILGLAGVALLSVFRPAADVDGATILLGKDTGALYVARDGVVHPVLNLASARLVAGSDADPVSADESDIGTRPRGALLGIPGAPSDLPGPDRRPGPGWTVCDSLTLDAAQPEARQTRGAAVTTTVVSGDLGPGAAPLATGQALLAAGPDGRTYLLYEGKRAQVDLGDSTTVRALGLSAAPRPVSAGLLGAVPEVAPLRPPVVPGAGSAPGYDLPGVAVGSVLAVGGADGARYYLALPGGVQQVSRAAAEVVAAGDASGRSDLSQLRSPSVLGRVPVVDPGQVVDLTGFPTEVPQLVEPSRAPVACLGWRPGGDGAAVAGAGGEAARTTTEPTRTLLAGSELPLPAGARTVGLAQADGSGPAVDAVYLPAGRAALVSAVGPTQPTAAGVLTLVTDTGVRFGLPDLATAGVLGLGQETVAAPQEVVRLLPQGPALDQTGALVAHDAVSGDPAGLAVPATAPGG